MTDPAHLTTPYPAPVTGAPLRAALRAAVPPLHRSRIATADALAMLTTARDLGIAPTPSMLVRAREAARDAATIPGKPVDGPVVDVLDALDRIRSFTEADDPKPLLDALDALAVALLDDAPREGR